MKFILKIFLIILSIKCYAVEADFLKNSLGNEQESFKKLDLNNVNQVKAFLKQMYLLDKELRPILNKTESSKILLQLASNITKFHSDALKIIIEKNGWMRISKFGTDADMHAWLIVQNAEHDTFFQAACLLLLEQLVDKGETNKQNYAYLYDRVAVKFLNSGMKQKYGTQLHIKNGILELYPYEGDLEEIDILRQSVGFEPIEEYLATARTAFKGYLKSAQPQETIKSTKDEKNK